MPGFALHDAWSRVLEEGWDEAKARAALAGAACGGELRPQEASEQSRFKLSYVHAR